MKLSNIIGKQVISIFDSTVIGTVFSFQLNKSKTCITDILLEGANSEVYLIPTSKIFASLDCILIKNNSPISLVADNYPPTMMNALVFDLAGRGLGNVIDIHYDERYQISSFITQRATISPKQIVNCTQKLILINTDTHYILSHFYPRTKFAQNSKMDVSILN
ncbi:MAG: hypothetical protein IKQ31_01255 [Clostridia bacterium]|nr:hypothetical protein [Clostridia bacterium]